MSAVSLSLPKRDVITTRITIGTFDEQVATIAALGALRRSSYVCCVNAHMTVEARDAGFASIVRDADLATADGMPVLFALRLFHGVQQERVAGNDLMPALMSLAGQRGLGVFLYGATNDVQQRIVDRAAREMPALRIAGMHSPPFGPLESLDLDKEAERINSSGAHIVLVSLGCPKQERWMAAMKGRVDAVMLGLGGAFLLYAGVDTRAPLWMRKLSLEWFYRLWLEPRRLWKRYLITNSVFVLLFLQEAVKRTFRRNRNDS